MGPHTASCLKSNEAKTAQQHNRHLTGPDSKFHRD